MGWEVSFKNRQVIPLPRTRAKDIGYGKTVNGMKDRISKSVRLLFILLILVFLTSCARQFKTAHFKNNDGAVLQFNKDGTFDYCYNGYSIYELSSGKYKINGNNIFFLTDTLNFPFITQVELHAEKNLISNKATVDFGDYKIPAVSTTRFKIKINDTLETNEFTFQDTVGFKPGIEIKKLQIIIYSPYVKGVYGPKHNPVVLSNSVYPVCSNDKNLFLRLKVKFDAKMYYTIQFPSRAKIKRTHLSINGAKRFVLCPDSLCWISNTDLAPARLK